jgi:hypothetical protein
MLWLYAQIGCVVPELQRKNQDLAMGIIARAYFVTLFDTQRDFFLILNNTLFQ